MPINIEGGLLVDGKEVGSGGELPFLVVPDTITGDNTLNQLLASINIDPTTLALNQTFTYTIFVQKTINLSYENIYQGLARLSIATYGGAINVSILQSRDSAICTISLNNITDLDTKIRSFVPSNVSIYYGVSKPTANRGLLTAKSGIPAWTKLAIHSIKLYGSNNNYLGDIIIYAPSSTQYTLDNLCDYIYYSYYNGVGSGLLADITQSFVVIVNGTMRHLKSMCLYVNSSSKTLRCKVDDISYADSAFSASAQEFNVVSIEYNSIASIF